MSRQRCAHWYIRMGCSNCVQQTVECKALFRTWATVARSLSGHPFWRALVCWVTKRVCLAGDTWKGERAAPAPAASISGRSIVRAIESDLFACLFFYFIFYFSTSCCSFRAGTKRRSQGGRVERANAHLLLLVTFSAPVTRHDPAYAIFNGTCAFNEIPLFLCDGWAFHRLPKTTRHFSLIFVVALIIATLSVCNFFFAC